MIGKNIINIQLKCLHDKGIILSNEILNLLSIAFFFNKNNKESFIENYSIEKYINILESDLERLKKNILDEVTNLNYKIYFFNPENFKVANLFQNKNYIEYESPKHEYNTIIKELTYQYIRCNYFIFYVEKLLENPVIFSQSYVEYLICFSFLHKELAYLLKSLNIIAKTMKFRKENAYQSYVPIPFFHRRYRIYNNHTSLYIYLKKIINEFIHLNKKYFDLENFDLNFIISSDYDIGDFIELDNFTDNALIKGSFFWRELARFQPIIIHEICHKIYRIIKKEYKEKLDKKIESIITVFHTIFDSPILNKEFFYKLKDDIVSDFFSYCILGDSYLFSLVFGGLLGINYYETLSDYSKDFEKNNQIKYKIHSLKFLLPAIIFDTTREKSIIRILLLCKIRDYFSAHERRLKYKNLLIKGADRLVSEIKEAIYDLFPVDISINSNEFNNSSYNSLASHKKNTVLLISKLCKKVINTFYRLFTESKFSIKPLFNTIYSSKFEINPDGIIKIFSEKFDNFHISIEDNKIFIDYSNNKFKVDTTNIYNILWHKLITDCKNYQNFDIIKKNIPEGRIYRSFLLSKNMLFQEVTNFFELQNYYNRNEKNNLQWQINLDELIFLKTRYLYETPDVNKKINYFKEILFSSKKKDLFFSIGPYESVFLYSDISNYESSKKDEQDIYKKILKVEGYLDRHSLFILKNPVFKKGFYRWKAFILIKFKFSTTESSYLDIIKDYKEKISFIGFSMGWEDIVICLNSNILDDIFEVKKKINFIKSIKRTETIIEINTNNKNINNVSSCNNCSKFKIIINIRLKDINKRPSLENFDRYLFPGRYDYTFLLKNESVSQEVEKKLLEIINLENLNLEFIKDISFNILEQY